MQKSKRPWNQVILQEKKDNVPAWNSPRKFQFQNTFSRTIMQGITKYCKKKKFEAIAYSLLFIN